MDLLWNIIKIIIVQGIKKIQMFGAPKVIDLKDVDVKYYGPIESPVKE